MKWSVSKKVYLVTLVGILNVTWTGLAAYFSAQQIDKIILQKQNLISALQNHMTADMMHDAIRGDILETIHLLSAKDFEEIKKTKLTLTEHIEIFEKSLQENAVLDLDPRIKKTLEGVIPKVTDYTQTAEKIVTTAMREPVNVDPLYPPFLEKFKDLEKSMAEVAEKIEESSKACTTTLSHETKDLGWQILISIGVGVAINFCVSTFMTRWIPKPFKVITDHLHQIAEETVRSSALVSSSSVSLSNSSNTQAASTEETSASLESISNHTRKNAENTQQAQKLAILSKELTDEGEKKMQELAAAMTLIQTSSNEISKIIKTIDEIAFQTNILALNAAVEAARAGEAGAGFAVVADEVRNLAQRSAIASQETESKIAQSLSSSKNGIAITNQVQDNLSKITSNIHTMNDLMQEISQSSVEETEGIEQVTNAMHQISSLTQKNAASAEETSSASTELEAQAERLKETVHQLELEISGEKMDRTVYTENAGAPLSNQTKRPLLGGF